MIKDQATRLVMSRVMLPVGTPQPVGFLLEIVVASVLGWLIQRCLSRLWPQLAENPGRIQLFRLDWAIRSGCYLAARHPQAIAQGLDGASLYRDHGSRLREAILSAGRVATATEWTAFRTANAPG